MDLALEERLVDLLARREYDAAATEALRGYGPGVYRFLCARMGDVGRADDAFAQLGEDLWRGLPTFRGASSFATWMFTLGRNAAHRIERSPYEQRRRRTGDSKLAALAEEIRTETAPYLRTDVKQRFRALRESLTPDERALLHLRVDADLAWDEIARIVEGDEALSDLPLRRASTRLRKRYSELCKQLRERAKAAGILGDDQ